MFLIPRSYYAIKKTKHKGRGVFAKIGIEPGVVIGDYLGKVITTEEAYRTEHLGTYYMEVTNPYSILADKNTVGIHLINHSCTPNCGTIDYKGRALYVAIRKIHKGEELTVNYNFGPPNKKTCSPCRHACYCGSVFCKGTMHSSLAKDKEIIEEYSKHIKLFSLELKKRYDKSLLALIKYPKKVLDDSFFDLFGYEKLNPIVLQNSRIPTVKKLREVIRNSGQTVAFPKLGLLVHGVMDSAFISTVLKKR